MNTIRGEARGNPDISPYIMVNPHANGDTFGMHGIALST